MGTTTRTRLLLAAFTLSLCGLGITTGVTQHAQVTSGTTVIIDDGDQGYHQTPTFTSSAFKGSYNDDTAYYLPPYNPSGTVALAQVDWTFEGLENGSYEVYTTWMPFRTFTRTATFRLRNGRTNVTVDTTVDQSRAPGSGPQSMTVNGQGWYRLGTADVFERENLIVTLLPGKSGYTVADAVLVRRTGDTTVGTPAQTSSPNCPVPGCAAPAAGCRYEPDTTLNAYGCPVHPCGILTCEPIHDASNDPVCGNAIVEDGEACDDGNHSPLDACYRCAHTTCGDAFVQASRDEQCDFGAKNGTQLDGPLPATACEQSSCKLLFCGDGVLTPWIAEQCDDGNMTNGDGCNARCQNEPRVACNDEQDNDGDGATDLNDRGCSTPSDTNEADGHTDLSVSVEADTTSAFTDETYVLTLTTANAGPDTATSLTRFSASIPEYVTYEPQLSAGNCTEVDGSVVCTVDRLSIDVPYAMTLTFRVRTSAPCDTAIDHTARVQESPQGDPVTTNNESIASLNIACHSSSSSSAASSSSSSAATTCGNAIVETGEQCDDGVHEREDACDDQCNITSTWWIDELQDIGPRPTRAGVIATSERLVVLPNNRHMIAWTEHGTNGPTIFASMRDANGTWSDITKIHEVGTTNMSVNSARDLNATANDEKALLIWSEQRFAQGSLPSYWMVKAKQYDIATNQWSAVFQVSSVFTNSIGIGKSPQGFRDHFTLTSEPLTATWFQDLPYGNDNWGLVTMNFQPGSSGIRQRSSGPFTEYRIERDARGNPLFLWSHWSERRQGCVNWISDLTAMRIVNGDFETPSKINTVGWFGLTFQTNNANKGVMTYISHCEKGGYSATNTLIARTYDNGTFGPEQSLETIETPNYRGAGTVEVTPGSGEHSFNIRWAAQGGWEPKNYTVTVP